MLLEEAAELLLCGLREYLPLEQGLRLPELKEVLCIVMHAPRVSSIKTRVSMQKGL